MINALLFLGTFLGCCIGFYEMTVRLFAGNNMLVKIGITTEWAITFAFIFMPGITLQGRLILLSYWIIRLLSYLIISIICKEPLL